MTTPSGPTDAAIEALAVGSPQRIGRFRYAVREGSWSWSDTFYRILGFEPGQVVPSATVLAAHLRPDGTAQARAAVEETFRTGVAFSFHTSIGRKSLGRLPFRKGIREASQGRSCQFPLITRW